MSDPLISVVLPVKNGGKYLSDAIESILTQSFSQLELLLVDDHSTDNAINELKNSDGRLRLLTSPGQGVVAAFNLGLARATGKFVARMDADDISLPQRLETQLSFLQDNPTIGIAGACVEIFSEQPIAGGNIHYQNWLNSLKSPDKIHKQMFIESPIPNPTAMFRREVLTELKGYRDTDWPEDYDLFLRADQAGIQMAKPEQTLFKWREHKQRLTHTDQRYSRLRFQQAKAHYLVNGRLPDSPLLIWGAGPSGRDFYDLLLNEGREACGFIDVHPRRIGGQKRGKPVWSYEHPDQWDEGFILVAVGSRGAKEEISRLLNQLGRYEGEHFVFVA
jgi:glycosyltransferase involved in cell wall biosynthesis